MNKKLFALLAVILVLSLLVIPALAGGLDVEAGRPVEGVWTYLPVGQVEEVFGNHVLMTISDEGDWAGDITGFADDYGEVWIHASGAMYYYGKVPFEGVTVFGRTGVMMVTTYGWKPDPFSDWEGTWEIIFASGELAGLQGGGTWEGPGWQGDPAVPGVCTYSGAVRFTGP